MKSLLLLSTLLALTNAYGAISKDDAGAITKALGERASTDCRAFVAKNTQERYANPEFFKNDIGIKACLVNHQSMLMECAIANYKTIAQRIDAKESHEANMKKLKQEQLVFKACLLRAQSITGDEIDVAAKDKAKMDIYFKRAVESLNKLEKKSKGA